MLPVILPYPAMLAPVPVNVAITVLMFVVTVTLPEPIKLPLMLVPDALLMVTPLYTVGNKVATVPDAVNVASLL